MSQNEIIKCGELLNTIDKLSIEELLYVYDNVTRKKIIIDNPNTLGNAILENHNIKCPKCNSNHIYRNGHDKYGKQKFICADCKATIRATNNTIFESSKLKIIKWNTFIKSFIYSDTLARSAQEVNVNVKTANLMRHKLMESLEDFQKDVILSGTIWLDEYQIKRNSKGKVFELNRPKRQHGKDAVDSIIDDTAIILLGIDDYDNIIAQFIGYGKVLKQEDAYNALINKIKKGSTVILDCADGYNTIIKELNLNVRYYKSLDTSEETLLEKKNIDDLCSNLADFFYKFHGVKDKYLQSYLNYFVFLRFLQYKESYIVDKIINTFSKAIIEGHTLKRRDLYIK